MKVSTGFCPCGSVGGPDAKGGSADVAEGAVALAEAPAGQPDLAEHGREGHREPRRLLAVLDTLERVVHVDQGPLRGHAPGQSADGRRGNLGQPGRPLRRLRTAVGRAEHVALEAVEADAVAREEVTVVESLRDEGVGEGEHDRDVAARHDGKPLGADELGQIAAQRAHQHELGAAGPRRAQVVARRMATGPARAHHGVLERDAAKADEELGVPLQHRPRGGPVQELPHRSDDVRHDDRLRAVAVAVLAAHVAAEAVEEAMELALGMVEATGATPAVRAAVDARAPGLGVHAA